MARVIRILHPDARKIVRDSGCNGGRGRLLGRFRCLPALRERSRGNASIAPRISERTPSVTRRASAAAEAWMVGRDRGSAKKWFEIVLGTFGLSKVLSAILPPFRPAVFRSLPSFRHANVPRNLLRGRRNSRRLPNRVVISFVFVQDAEPFRNFPARLQLVKFGRTHPGLRVRFGIVDDDLQFQRVMIQSPVALGKMRLRRCADCRKNRPRACR